MLNHVKMPQHAPTENSAAPTPLKWRMPVPKMVARAPPYVASKAGFNAERETPKRRFFWKAALWRGAGCFGNAGGL